MAFNIVKVQTSLANLEMNLTKGVIHYVVVVYVIVVAVVS